MEDYKRIITDKRGFLFELTGDWNLFTLNEEEIDKIFNIVDSKIEREVK